MALQHSEHPIRVLPCLSVSKMSLLWRNNSEFGIAAPGWARQIGGLDKPRYLLGDPNRYPRFYARCVRESPEPLKRRNLIAPNDYLSFA